MTDGMPRANAGEVVEPLDDKYCIIQPRDGYRFGSDAVALAHFASAGIKKDARVLDLCSGCGIIGIMLNIESGAEALGVEIDNELCDMSNRCARDINGQKDVRFVNADIRTFATHDNICLYGKFDAVVCNPPFFKANSKRASVAPAANSELTVTFDDIAATAKAFLKPCGVFYIVHTATRLDEILSTCRSHGLMPKDMVINPNGKTFMLKSVLGARPGMNVAVRNY